MAGSARTLNRRLPTALAAAAVLLVWLIAGCRQQESAGPKVDEVDLTVGMPDDGSDPGQITNQPIAPPDVEVAAAPPGDAGRPADGSSVDGPMADGPAAAAEISVAEQQAAAPESYTDWPQPELVLVVSGQQHGYIEPCGCTGLDNQKGGLARRFTLLEQLKQRGWKLLPIDAGNQVRRMGRQPEIKFQTTVAGLTDMGYRAIGFGPDDLRLGVGELLAVAAGDAEHPSLFVSANVTLLDPTLMPTTRQFDIGGRKVGVTSVLDPASMEYQPSDEILIESPVEATKEAVAMMQRDGSDFQVVMFFGTEEAAAKTLRTAAAKDVDLLVVAGGHGEPTYKPQPVEGTDALMVVTGDKGMYVGLVGLFADGSMRYARVPLTSELEDADEIMKLMASYQNQLKSLGLEGLGLRPIPHPKGTEFIGTEACGKCHTTAYEIWQGTPHAEATESLVHPGERTEIPRHFDPECLSCHVTGWNPQNYYPYTSGYLSLETSSHLTGNGCENCHGPGADHAAAEAEGSDVAEAQRTMLREAMRLPLSEARERCMECHDLDNSPDFHQPGAFEDEYWPTVEHYGMD